MSHSTKNQIGHSHLIKQPSFKHSLMAALVISLGGTSLATWAGESVTKVASAPLSTTPSTTVKAQTAFNPENCEGQYSSSPQERTQRHTEAFQQADTNKDGKVNLTEWLAFKPDHRGSADGQRPDRLDDRHENHQEQSGKNLVAWLQKVDANHDGQISKAEAESYAPRLAKHFSDIDTDHNGLISQDELKASHDARKAQWQARSVKNRTAAFEKADTNHDGQLTLTEWLAFKPQHHGFWPHLWHRWFGDHDKDARRDHDQQQGPRGNLFKKVDTNDDGKISLSEAQTNAPRLAEHFNEIDTDHDGQISQDERRAAFKAACAKSLS